MWLYVRERNEYQVGFYHPEKYWVAIETYLTVAEAREAVHYLNGGQPSTF